MDIKQALFFGFDRSDGSDDSGIGLASCLTTNDFGIEVINSKETVEVFQSKNIIHIITNSLSITDIFSNLSDWYKKSERHCAVVVLPKPLALNQSTFELICCLRVIIQEQLLGRADNVWLLSEQEDYRTFQNVLNSSNPTERRQLQRNVLASSLNTMAESVLVIGGGGREHAIVHALTRSAQVGHVYTCPGNYGTQSAGRKQCVCENVAQMNREEVAHFVRKRGVSLVIVGPEKPLVEGMCDYLQAQGIACFGPSAAAAQLESSKAWAKQFMQMHGIPTAEYAVFRDFAQAKEYVEFVGYRVVVKASGLADGKGVLLPTTTSSAVEALHAVLTQVVFGSAGEEVVVERYLEGEEVSVLAFCDGNTAVGMPPAQDHKRLLAGDAGPNTGGMGAYAPSPLITPAQYAECMHIVQRTVTALAEQGTPFKGVLYAGFMLTRDRGPLVLEYNCRFGDPETQVLLPLLSSESDLYSICMHCVHGTLQPAHVQWRSGVAACTVVCAAGGYPADYTTGHPIRGLESITDLQEQGTTVTVYHAGSSSKSNSGSGGSSGSSTCENNSCSMYSESSSSSNSTSTHTNSTTSPAQPVTSGGRVLGVTGTGATLRDAVHAAYRGVHAVSFEGMQYRTDIAQRGLQRPLRIGVLGSTNGTSLQPLIDTLQQQHTTQLTTLNATIVVLISNKPNAGILQRAAAHSIPHLHLSAAHLTREAYDTLLIQALENHGVDLVLMVGYMRIASSVFTAHYANRCVNVHPSLLPAFPGGMDTAVHEEVLRAQCTTSGCSVHLVTDTVDAGEVLVQRQCSVDPRTDTVDSLKARVQALEGEALVEVVQMYVDGTVSTPNRFVEHYTNLHHPFTVTTGTTSTGESTVHSAPPAHITASPQSVLHTFTPPVARKTILTADTTPPATQTNTSTTAIHYTPYVTQPPTPYYHTQPLSPASTAHSPYTPYTPYTTYTHEALHSPTSTTTHAPHTPTTLPTPLTYASSGVHIEAGEALVQAIKPFCASTRRSGCSTVSLGGYGGLFDLRDSGHDAADTVLVAGTDGVGTKLKLAVEMHTHHTIGIDLVAMCVNDILVCGAEPLLFLDYYATAVLHTDTAVSVVQGIAQGCVQAGCALIGGETAEMPGMYQSGDYDLAGFAVGAVRRPHLLPRIVDMTAGDVLIGLPSTGLHSNGFSLVRRCIEQCGLSLHDPPPFDSPHATFGEALLEPTAIYVSTLLPLLGESRSSGRLKGMAHITGGGLTGNIPRVLPPHLVAVLHTSNSRDSVGSEGSAGDAASESPIQQSQWRLPPVFQWVQRAAQLPLQEMLITFNCGLGMVLVVGREDSTAVLSVLQEQGSEAFVVGQLRDRRMGDSSSVEVGAASSETEGTDTGGVQHAEAQVQVLGTLW